MKGNQKGAKKVNSQCSTGRKRHRPFWP